MCDFQMAYLKHSLKLWWVCLVSFVGLGLVFFFIFHLFSSTSEFIYSLILSPSINYIFPLFWIVCHVTAYPRWRNTSLLQSPKLRRHQLSMKIGFLNHKLEDNNNTLNKVDKRMTEDFSAAVIQGLLLISKSGLKNQSLLWKGWVLKSLNYMNLFCSPTYLAMFVCLCIYS